MNFDQLVERLLDPNRNPPDMEWRAKIAAAITALQGERDEARKKAGKLHDYANMRDAQVTDLSAEVARLKTERDELLGEVKRLAISEAVETRSAEEHEAENARLKAELAEAHRFIDIAFEYEGDVFGVHHNDAVDFLCRNSLKPDGQKTGEKG